MLQRIQYSATILLVSIAWLYQFHSRCKFTTWLQFWDSGQGTISLGYSSKKLWRSWIVDATCYESRGQRLLIIAPLLRLVLTFQNDSDSAYPPSHPHHNSNPPHHHHHKHKHQQTSTTTTSSVVLVVLLLLLLLLLLLIIIIIIIIIIGKCSHCTQCSACFARTLFPVWCSHGAGNARLPGPYFVHLLGGIGREHQAKY